MDQTTIGKLSEIILDTYYKVARSDDSAYTKRYIAELVAMEIAEFARMNAFENSNQGEVTYASDQFISVFKNVDILVDGDEKYSILPATPTALPNNQEITSVRIVGNRSLQCIPMRSKDAFMQDFFELPMWMVLYSIENGKIVYTTSNPLIEGKVNIRMVGAVQGDKLTDSVLNIPKNYEIQIHDKIIARLLPNKGVPQDTINDSISGV